ncbi:transcription intermediary factor 1-beta-like, partial [Dendronephthya gigantea]|uniref:transcription intermediary factor 1-beta-like n=1 Tax=Dendronephthya gigantea TaxID=151771 RepID=UPI00106D7033
MARALETDPINKLQENLQCTVCREPLKDPRTLPCFHSFCKDCLEGVVKTRRNKAPRGRPVRDIPCPNCREMFTLDPDKNVADMKRNHFICNMVKATAVLNRDRGTGVPCSHECSQSYSVARCVTCEKFLCQECLTAHDSYRGHTGHSVLTMEELSKPENRKKINDKMYCNEHSGEILKVYCETCDQLICKDCMDFRHTKPDHSCFLAKDVGDKYKELLASNNETMDDVLTEGNALLQKLTRMTEEFGKEVEDVNRKIIQRKKSVAKMVCKVLDENGEELLKEVNEIYNDEQAKLDKQTKKIKQYVENVQKSVQLSKKLVEEGTEEE